MEVIDIDEQAFEALLQSGKPFLVDYWAPWCVHCRRIAPAYEKLAQRYGEKLTLCKVNTDDAPALANRERIQAIPTLIFYRDGKAQGSVLAPQSQAAMEEFIQGLL